MAIKTIRASRWRSLMTVMGIIIGVVAVITIVSLGEGAKRQVIGQIGRIGDDLIVVRSGNGLTRDRNGNILKVNQLADLSFGSGNLSNNDYEVIIHTPGIKQFAPLGLINSGAQAEGIQYNDGVIIATNEQLAQILNIKTVYGNFFTNDESSRRVAVIGKRVAEQLFDDNAPIGFNITIRNQDFVIVGILEETSPSPLILGPDFNKAIFIPYALGRATAGSVQLVQVLARADSTEATTPLISGINQRLLTARGGLNDFSVMRQGESFALTSSIFNLFTAFIAGVAAMSLVVGGIGIMNIMLASVTERTREIGIRKAVGATNRQIALQFFVESMVLSNIGGLIGVAMAYVVNALIIVSTHLEPVITWQTVVLAFGVSLVVGIAFGTVPALRAARKDPIDALRYE